MEIYIGKIIKEVFEDSGLSINELASRINNTRQNLYGIFERRTIDTGLLLRLRKPLIIHFSAILRSVQGINQTKTWFLIKKGTKR